jgi:hypothetical protein
MPSPGPITTRRSLRLLVPPAVLLCLLAAPRAEAQFLYPEDVYESVKGLEERLPVYAPVSHINMGTFDARSGAFQGLTTEVGFERGDKPSRRPSRPRRIEKTPRRKINGSPLDLWVNRSPRRVA